MKVKNYSELREQLAAVMDETVNDGVPVLITRPKNKHCILMSYSKYTQYESIAEEYSKLRVTKYSDFVNSAKQLHDLTKN